MTSETGQGPVVTADPDGVAGVPFWAVGEVVELETVHDVEEGRPVEGSGTPLVVAPILDGATRFIGVTRTAARAGGSVQVEIRKPVHSLVAGQDIATGQRVACDGALFVALGPGQGAGFLAVRL